MIQNYLVGAGFAIFELDFIFEFEAMFEFECVADELVVITVFETVVVLPLVVEAVFETEVVAAEFVVVVFALFVLAVLFAVSPPQAIPRAVKPKRADSAIIFFIESRSPVFLKD